MTSVWLTFYAEFPDVNDLIEVTLDTDVAREMTKVHFLEHIKDTEQFMPGHTYTLADWEGGDDEGWHADVIEHVVYDNGAPDFTGEKGRYYMYLTDITTKADITRLTREAEDRIAGRFRPNQGGTTK